MAVVVPNGYEGKWTERVKYLTELRGLTSIMKCWSLEGWVSELVNKKQVDQMNLF